MWLIISGDRLFIRRTVMTPILMHRLHTRAPIFWLRKKRWIMCYHFVFSMWCLLCHMYLLSRKACCEYFIHSPRSMCASAENADRSLTSSALDFCHILCPSNYANNCSHIFNVHYWKFVVKKAHRCRIYAIKCIIVSESCNCMVNVFRCVLRKVCLESIYEWRFWFCTLRDE